MLQYWSYKQGFWFKKHCKLCKKHGGAHTTHATKDCPKYEKDRTVKGNFCAAKKAGKKPNPTKQSFAQLSNKLDKLKEFLEKASLKSKNAAGMMAILTAPRKLGQVALGN